MPGMPQSTADRNRLPCVASHSHVLSKPQRAALAFRPRPLVVVLCAIVYCLGSLVPVVNAEPPGPGGHGAWPVSEPLPPAAEAMRQALLDAVQSGRIDDLKIAYDLGELRADIADEAVSDPIAYWKKVSSDGEGQEVLAILGNLLAVGAAQVARGKDPENAAIYVWPYIAEVPLDTLTPSQRVDLLRLMPSREVQAMIAGKTWTWWRLTIGADGLWHSFKKGS
jgi:hypothetical protein